MAKLTVMLDDELMYAFKRQALEDRRSVSDVVRRFVEAYAGGVLAAGDIHADEGGVVGANGLESEPVVHQPSLALSPAASICSREAKHHINHGGRPCPECGWPTGDE